MTLTNVCLDKKLSSRRHINLGVCAQSPPRYVFLDIILLIFVRARVCVLHAGVIRSRGEMMSIFRLAHLTAEQIQLD